jgi:CheY-like chemotaxis protein
MNPIPKRSLLSHIGRFPHLSGEAKPARTRTTPSSGSPSVEKPQTRILVVDDQPDAASMLGELLVDLGHAVAIAHTGQAALDIAATFQPDVALLDLRLPQMDGYELASRLRASTDRKLRLIAVTGYGPGSDSAKAAKAGFEAYLVKPVTLDQLKSILRPH